MPIIHSLETTQYFSLIYRNANPEASQFMQINSPERNKAVCLGKIWTKPGIISKVVIPTGTKFWCFVNRENCLVLHYDKYPHRKVHYYYFIILRGMLSTHEWCQPCRSKIHGTGLRATVFSPGFHLPLYRSLKDSLVNTVSYKPGDT